MIYLLINTFIFFKCKQDNIGIRLNIETLANNFFVITSVLMLANSAEVLVSFLPSPVANALNKRIMEYNQQQAQQQQNGGNGTVPPPAPGQGLGLGGMF